MPSIEMVTAIGVTKRHFLSFVVHPITGCSSSSGGGGCPSSSCSCPPLAFS